MEVATTVYDAAGRKVRQAPPLQLVRYQDGDAHGIRCNFRISTAQLSAGQYTLAIEAADRLAGKSTARRETFAVQ